MQFSQDDIALLKCVSGGSWQAAYDGASNRAGGPLSCSVKAVAGLLLNPPRFLEFNRLMLQAFTHPDYKAFQQQVQEHVLGDESSWAATPYLTMWAGFAVGANNDAFSERVFNSLLTSHGNVSQVEGFIATVRCVSGYPHKWVSDEADSPAILAMARAFQAMKNGNLETAANYFVLLVKACPEFAEGYCILGRIALRNQNRQMAAAFYRKYLLCVDSLTSDARIAHEHFLKEASEALKSLGDETPLNIDPEFLSPAQVSSQAANSTPTMRDHEGHADPLLSRIKFAFSAGVVDAIAIPIVKPSNAYKEGYIFCFIFSAVLGWIAWDMIQPKRKP